MSTSILEYSLEGSNAVNLIAWMNNSWGFPLCPHENNVDKLCRRRHGVHLLEVVDWHGNNFPRYRSNQNPKTLIIPVPTSKQQ
jgi:hypothetical protein